MKQAILTVFGKDRPGIIAGVTGVLFHFECNLEDISMTILEGELAMMMIVSFKTPNRLNIQKAFAAIQKKWGVSFLWNDLKGRLRRGEKHSSNCVTFLVTAMGKDRTGIVYQTSQLLARLGLNITDLNSKILGRGESAIYAMMLEVDIPKKVKIVKLRRALQTLAKKLDIDIQIKPVERLQI